MPARTRNAAAPAAAPGPTAATTSNDPEPESSSSRQHKHQQSQSQSQPTSSTTHRLQFSEPLSWRAGKAIPISDLLSRLQTLALELRKLDQEETDRDSLRKISQDLGGGHLLAHRDKGVRAWTACCVVDVLRLCAPDAPFTGAQLKDIFTAIITSIIPALADPSNAYNGQHIYVLSSLAEVKSIVLLTDLDSADSLILPLFTSCFDIVSGSSKASTGEELAKNVEYDMTRLLVTVIDEAVSLAPEVVDIIVAQFLRVDPRIMERGTTATGKGKKSEGVVDTKQDTLLLKDYPPAYNMAKAICSACPGKMTSYISQYFNNVIIDASAPGGMNGLSKSSAHRRASLHDSEDEGEDIKELSKAHRLIRELWRACPDVLQNVVPQLEAELSAESVSLRLLATQAIGDIAAGIGIAGPPPPAPMEPSSYPPVTLANYAQTIPQPNILLTPLSPKPFSQAHSAAYESFLSRRQDKSVSVRAAWATAIGRILLTSAGGGGLSSSEEQALITSLSTMLRDADEKVRMAAVDVMGRFGFHDIITKFGAKGGISDAESILSILAERVKDKKHPVRERAMKILARMWAIAAGEIEENNEEVIAVLGEGPSRIFDAYYTNDQDIHVLIDHVLFEILLPLNYPPIKSKGAKAGSSQSRKSKSLGGDGDVDVDKIRVRRIMTLLKGLDDKAKKVFFSLQVRQLNMKKLVDLYLTACEKHNGGVMDKDEANIKAHLTRVVDNLAKTLPESSRVSADLWKFAKAHDRRNYQLIRFSMALVSDYRTVTKAIRELSKRIQGSSGATASLLETLTPLLYRCSSLLFNRSHIPAIMELSRTDEHGLANPAHEMLREISSRNPEVLEAHVQEMCKDLEAQAPTATKKDDPGAEEILKACAGFAKKLPSKLPKERKFLLALTNYALYSSSPRAAKHAVSIIMAGATKKEMYAKDLIQKSVKNYEYGSNHFLTKLATISQLYLLAPKEADWESDEIISIAINQTLLNNRSPQVDAGYSWSDAVDEETSAKEWALRIIVNSLRSKENSDEDGAKFKAHAEPIYSILNTLVSNEGELSKAKDTPAAQKSRLRLLAAKLLLKLCSSRSICDRIFTNKDFNALALVAQDQLLNVRAGFISQLKKRLTQDSHLGYRWYTIAFLLAFEPSSTLKDGTLTWLRSRASFFARQAQVSGKGSDTVMESVFARLLSLLAHHPDYPTTSSPGEEVDDINDLVDFSRYILFYLSAVANENNLSLIFHVAQRVKQSRDAVLKSESVTTHLHTLSDLAQATIRRFAEFYSQQHKIGGSGGSGAANILQTYPGKMRLPSSLFAPMASHQEAQDAAEKNYLPDEVEDVLDRTVRAFMKPKTTTNVQALAKKRKLEAKAAKEIDRSSSAKKVKKEKKRSRVDKALPIRASASSSGVKEKRKSRKGKNDDEWEEKWSGEVGASRRKSVRESGAKKGVSYAEVDSEEDDIAMEEWDQRDEEEDGEEGSEEESEEEGSGEENEEAEDEDEADVAKQASEEVEEASKAEQDGDGDVAMSDAAKEEEEVEEAEEEAEKSPSPSPPRRGGRTRSKRAAAAAPTTTSPPAAKTKSKSKPKPETKTKQKPEPKGKPEPEEKSETVGTRRSTRRAAAG